MALIEYDEYKQRLRDLGPELEKLSAALDMDSARAEARKLEDETAQDGFWNDLERSQKVQQRLKQLQNKIARQDKLVTEWQDLTALCEMGQEAEDEELLEELKSGFQTLEEKIEEIVLGHPKNMDGTEGPRAEKAREFAALLREATGLEARLWDERRSSIEAHAILSANGKREKKHKKTVDALAAALILEAYLGRRG